MGALRRDPLLAVLLVLGVLGLLAALQWKDEGFPVAAIDFRVLQGDAVRLAREYVRERLPGLDPERHLVAIGFGTDPQGQAYVERHAGLAELNRLGNAELPLWWWRVRFFRPLQRQEVSVQIHPSGRVIGFQHTIPEEQPGASLDDTAAREVAERFLAEGLRRDLRQLRLVDSRREARPSGRVDHFLTWERTDLHVAEATHRIRVTVQGDVPGGFQERLRLPEAWTVEQRREANRGVTLAGMSQIGYAALVLAALVVAFRRLRGGGLAWRFGAGFAVAAGTLIVLATLNSLPLFLLGYPTEAELPAYLGQALLSGAAGALILGLLILLTGASGAAVAHDVQPERPGLASLASRVGLRSYALVRSVVAGYGMAGLFAGYVVVFYWAGLRLFGVWVPVEVPYDDIMSTVAPVVYPLTIGVYPAISEEFSFRLFAVPFLALALVRWLPRRRWLALAIAVLVPSVVWAALHSTYPQQPFYTRAVELTVVGALFGVLSLRYGVLATIVSHYLFNAGVTGALFFRSGNPYLLLSGAAPLVLPALALVPAALEKLRGGSLLTDSELVARTRRWLAPVAAPSRRPAAQGVVPEEIARLPVLGRRAAVATSVVALAALALAAAFPVPAPSDVLQLRLGRGEALERSRGVLRDLGVRGPLEKGWIEHAAVAGPPPAGPGGSPVRAAGTYLRRRLGTQEANRLLVDAQIAAGWRVRYFRSLQREEVVVRLAPDGRLAGFQHVREEEAPGARLPAEEARALAERTWEDHGLPLSRYRPVDVETEVREGRADHRFIWERPETGIGDARLRVAAEVHGDRPGQLRRLVKVPEAFERALVGMRTHQVAAGSVLGVAAAAFGLWLLVVYARAIRAGEVNGRFGIAAAGIAVGATAVQSLMEIPELLQGYVTTISLPSYLLLRAAGALVALALTFVATFVAATLAEWLYRQSFPGRPPVAGQLLALWPRASMQFKVQSSKFKVQGSESHKGASPEDTLNLERGTLNFQPGTVSAAPGAPALAAAAVPALGLLGVMAAVGLAHGWLSETALRQGLAWSATWPLGLLNAGLPVVHALAGAVVTATMGTAALGVVALGLRRWLAHPTWVAGALLLVGIAVSAAGARSWLEFARGATQWGLAVPAGSLALRWLARERITAYALAAFAAVMTGAARALLSQEPIWYQINGWLVLLLGLGPLVLGAARLALRREVAEP